MCVCVCVCVHADVEISVKWLGLPNSYGWFRYFGASGCKLHNNALDAGNCIAACDSHGEEGG